MRLLVATMARGALGGIETYLRALTPALSAHGHEVALLFEHGYDRGAPAPWPGAAAQWCLEECGAAPALAAARAWRPDLVWTHGLESARFEAALAELAPAIASAHNFDGACATGTKLHQWPRPRPCVRAFGPACVPVNFTRRCGSLRPLRFAAGYRRQRQRRRQLDRYRALVVGSPYLAGEFRRLGVAPARIHVVLYPLSAPPASSPGVRPGQGRVLMLARLTPAKGGAVLVEAAALAQATLGRRLPLLLAGDGPERPRLLSQARRLGVDAEFPGWLDLAQRRAALATVDLVAVPSLWPEPFGMVGLEAASEGVGAVAFDVGGIAGWLRPGMTGELAPGDPPTALGLAAALVRALADPAAPQRLGENAWASCAAFSPAAHCAALDRVFRAALAEAACAGR